MPYDGNSAMSALPRIVIGLVLAAFVGVAVPLASPVAVKNGGSEVRIYDDSVALLIGLSEYQDKAHWSRLPFIKREIEQVHQVLLRHNFEVISRNDLRASELKSAIKDFLLRHYPRRTRLVVFVAGHGWSDNQQLTGHIVPIDAPSDATPKFRSMLLNMEDIKEWSKMSSVDHILFLFDSCFSGAVFLNRSGYRASELYLSDALRRVRQFITAGDERQVVPTRSQFVPALLEGIGDGKADLIRDGLISATELGEYVKDRVSRLGETTPQFGHLPESKVLPGNVLFVARSSAVNVPAQPPKDATPAQRIAAAVGIPRPDRSVFLGLRILYYRKAADGRRVLDVLEQAGIPFENTRAILPERFPVNAVACGPSTNVEALKSLALTLIEGGVPVRVVLQYGDPSRLKGDLEIISLTKGGRGAESLDTPSLRRTDIEKLDRCPSWLQR